MHVAQPKLKPSTPAQADPIEPLEKRALLRRPSAFETLRQLSWAGRHVARQQSWSTAVTFWSKANRDPRALAAQRLWPWQTTERLEPRTPLRRTGAHRAEHVRSALTPN